MSFYATVGVLVISRYREIPRCRLRWRRVRWREEWPARNIPVAGGSEPGGGIFVGGASAPGDAIRVVGACCGRLAVRPEPDLDRRSGVSVPTPILSPERVNAYTLASYLADTGASEHKDSGTLRRFLYSPRSI